MPKLKVETSEREKPLFLLVGEKNPLIPALLNEYGNDFKIAHISQDSPDIDSNHIYHIKPDTASLIKNLEEKIDYAIVFLEENTEEHAGHIFEKLRSDNAKTVVIADIEKPEKFYDLTSDLNKSPSFYFLLAGDVYSESPNFNNNSETAKIIEDVITNKEVVLTGNDLKPIFPIYVKDAMRGINQILLGPKKSQKIYYLFYEHPQTYISAVHILQRLEPDLKIKYLDRGQAERFENIESLEREIKENTSLKPSYLDSYLEGFEKSLIHFMDRGEIKETSRLKIINLPKKVVTVHKPKIKFLGKAVIFSLIFFIIANIAAGAIGAVLLRTSAADFARGDYKSAEGEIKTARVFLDFVDPVARIVVKTAGYIGFPNLDKNYNTFTKAVSLANIASSDFEKIQNFSSGITQSSIEQKIADAFFLYFEGQNLQAETKNRTLSAILTPDLPKILALSKVIPQILGYEREKTYLLLFQNNGELRPTGGFIGSVGELKIKDGKVEDLNLQDVYEYDGKLTAHIEPHYVVRRFLQPHMYLRDSNFDPDFQGSASNAALLYNLETKHKVDGVIGLNFEAVRQLIGSLGEIKLAAYNQTLNKDNTFDFLEKTIDNNFFPGSTQKKDVLQALFNQTTLKLGDKNLAVQAARLLPRLMQQKQIIFAFNETSIQSVFSALDFGGEYIDSRTADFGTINDFLGVNEANIGVNKANIGVSRSTVYKADLSGSKIISNVVHKLDNESDKDYKVYIRFITPAGSQLSSIKIDGKIQNVVPAVTDFKVYEKKNFKAPAGLEVDQGTVDGESAFGFITTVSAKSKQAIEVNYTNGLKIPRDSQITYSLELIKQPGTLSYPFALRLIYGSAFSPKSVEGATPSEGEIDISKTIDADQEFPVQLVRR